MSTKPQSDDICFDDAPVVPNNWTAENEAEYQRYCDDLDADYNEQVRQSYVARGQANLY